MFRVNGLVDLMNQFDRMGSADEVAERMLNKASPIVITEMKGTIHEKADKGFSDKEQLEQSIDTLKDTMTRYSVLVTAKGYDNKWVRNNEKLAYLHYGTAKQDARPILTPVRRKCREKCYNVMNEEFNAWVKWFVENG